MLEAVVNVSEGRDRRRIDAIGAAARHALIDVHLDPDHHRSVFTLAASESAVTEAAVRRLVEVALEDLDLREHVGVHPRLGVVDVVPFVALPPTPADVAVAAAHAFGAWLARVHHVPVFFYADAAPDARTLPTVRRDAFSGSLPPTSVRTRPTHDSAPPRSGPARRSSRSTSSSRPTTSRSPVASPARRASATAGCSASARSVCPSPHAGRCR